MNKIKNIVMLALLKKILLRRHEVGTPTEDAPSNPNIDELIGRSFR